jgi:transcriptional regulator with XRE-family HTH domain
MKIMSLKEYREKVGLTLRQLAKELGYRSASYLSEVESGKKQASGQLSRRVREHSKDKVYLIS